ncbi:MAG: tRNA (adenosine(37)-N6)-dimethylallyltransferase, partial [Amnibacterium sp.]
RGIPHHCFDLWDVTDTASVAVYRDAARAAIRDIEARGAVPLLVGGSGLYVEAVLKEHDLPATDPELRADQEQQADQLGPHALWRRLAEADPVAAGRIPSGNLRRVIRALEVVTLTGRPYAASLPDQGAWWTPAVRVTVDVETAVLQPRLADRARGMWAYGLLEEVRGLLPEGLAEATTAARAVGYAQALAVLRGTMTTDEAVEETIRLTWRMVRRQRAWFGRDDGALRIDGAAPGGAAAVLAALRAAEAAASSP